MKKFLWVHIILELVGGLSVFLYPNLLFFGGESLSQAFPVVKIYGLLAICFSAGYVFIYQNADEKSKLFIQFYLLAMAFQLFIAFQCYGLMKSSYLNHPGPFYLHLSAFICLTIGYFLHRFDKPTGN